MRPDAGMTRDPIFPPATVYLDHETIDAGMGSPSFPRSIAPARFIPDACDAADVVHRPAGSAMSAHRGKDSPAGSSPGFDAVCTCPGEASHNHISSIQDPGKMLDAGLLVRHQVDFFCKKIAAVAVYLVPRSGEMVVFLKLIHALAGSEPGIKIVIIIVRAGGDETSFPH